MASLSKAKRAFRTQRYNAERRGIKFKMTFDEWWLIWQTSGKWYRRGKQSGGSYQMCRFGDRGPYAVGNVKIQTLRRNSREADQKGKHSPEGLASIRNAQKGNKHSLGRKHSKKERLKMSRSLKGRVPGFLGKRHSEKTKALKRMSWRNQFGCGPNYVEK